MASGGFSRALEADHVLGVGLCVVVYGGDLWVGQTVELYRSFDERSSASSGSIMSSRPRHECPVKTLTRITKWYPFLSMGRSEGRTSR